jgi:tetratricopeptide (TPR) repeat protein
MARRFFKGWSTERAVAWLLLATSVFLRAQHQNETSLAQQADNALRSNDYEHAIASYVQLLRLEPRSAAAWSNLGTAWFGKGDYAKASRSFARASHLQPASADYAFNSALSLIRQDKCADAQTYLQMALRSDAYARRGHYLAGMCAFVSKQWLKAKQELKAAGNAGHRSAEMYYMLAIAARKTNDPVEAKQAYDHLRTNYSSSSFYHEITAEALDRADEDSDAEKQLAMAIATDPRAISLHAQLGLLLWKSHRLSEAERAFKSELELDPQSYSALHFLGDIAEQTNRPEEALAWYKWAMKVQPESGEAHFCLGRVLETQGRSQPALKELTAAASRMPDDASVHYWSAKTLKHLGRMQDAKKELDRVREIQTAERSALLQRLGNGGQ